jgi:hypothetical protein
LQLVDVRKIAAEAGGLTDEFGLRQRRRRGRVLGPTFSRHLGAGTGSCRQSQSENGGNGDRSARRQWCLTDHSLFSTLGRSRTLAVTLSSRSGL